jgi:hypothetical protein
MMQLNRVSVQHLIEVAADKLIRQAVPSRIDIFREVEISGAMVRVRLKITADYVDERAPFPIEV